MKQCNNTIEEFAENYRREFIRRWNNAIIKETAEMNRLLKEKKYNESEVRKMYKTRPKYLQDFEFEHGYCIFEREEEITDHLSDFTYEIKSVNTARFMKTPNLYDLYKSMREVSKEEFFNELEKETHINYIRDFPIFNNYVTFYDSRKNGFINLNNY